MRRSWRRERVITPEGNWGTRIPALMYSVAVWQTAYSRSIALKDPIQLLALSTQIMLELLFKQYSSLDKPQVPHSSLHTSLCARRYTVWEKIYLKKRNFSPLWALLGVFKSGYNCYDSCWPWDLFCLIHHAAFCSLTILCLSSSHK